MPNPSQIAREEETPPAWAFYRCSSCHHLCYRNVHTSECPACPRGVLVAVDATKYDDRHHPPMGCAVCRQGVERSLKG